MVPIPGGAVDLRDDRLGTRWQTSIAAPFLLGRFPVREIDLEPSGSDRPVVNVSWLDAIEMCNGLSARSGLEPGYRRDAAGGIVWDRAADGYRLPTEAEWQYACKAGTTGYRYGEIDEIAWYADNSGGRLHDAGGKAANPWGLHDMLGNVWEWCWDLYDEQVYGSYRIFRGGGWAESLRGCGASVRRRSHPTFAIDDLGFRVARTVGSGRPDGQRSITTNRAPRRGSSKVGDQWFGADQISPRSGVVVAFNVRKAGESRELEVGERGLTWVMRSAR